MNPRFEEHDGKLFRMLEEPEPLQPDSPMPCVVRYIQDCSPMGRYMKRKFAMVINTVAIVSRIGTDGRAYSSDEIFAEEVEVLEIIGYPVEEGSAEWALYQMMQGKKVIHKYTIGNVCCALNQDGNVQYYHTDNLAYIGKIRSKLEFVKKNVAKTGWQLYEPEPEPAKEPEIVAHKQHANCLVCGKEIEGLLDGHATVSIKRYSISSLYESTYSHYCGKCFLELGFDATERKLRNRQQPIAEPEPAQQYKVGDWVEMDYKGTLYHRQVISVHDNGIRVEFGGATPLISFDGKSGMLLIRLVRKLKPNEVEVDFGFAKGRILSRTSGDVKVLNNKSVVIATIIVSEITNPATRELVEGLLEAQEEEE